MEHGRWALAPDPRDVAVFGGGGDDTIYGGQGDQLLSGDDGNDTARGGWGAQLLMGEGSYDTIQAGDGNQTLVGGAGRDVFALDMNVVGRIVIADFRPGQDWIEVARGANGLTLDGPLDLLSRVSADHRGAAVLDFGGGSSVTLSGISAQHVREHVQEWIRVV